MPNGQGSDPFPMLVCIGSISGTSMDAIDVAMLRTDGRQRCEAGAAGSWPLEPSLRGRLVEVAGDQREAHAKHDELERDVSNAFADAIEQFMAASSLAPSDIDLVGFHGQTILHDPKAGFTRQLGDGQLLASRLGIDVVANFRGNDIARGGEGAPLAPLYHGALAAALPKPVCFLNLGGVANLTFVAESEAHMLACDTGPASAMIDDLMRARLSERMDKDGALAASGMINHALVEEFKSDPYLSRPMPKSLDRNHFHGWLAQVNGLSAAAAAATLTELSVVAVAAAARLLPQKPLGWLACGGGRHNSYMMRRLALALDAPVEPVERIDADGDALEAQLFGYLAARSAARLPLSFPGTTGVREPATGGVLYRAKRS